MLSCITIESCPFNSGPSLRGTSNAESYHNIKWIETVGDVRFYSLLAFRSEQDIQANNVATSCGIDLPPGLGRGVPTCMLVRQSRRRAKLKRQRLEAVPANGYRREVELEHRTGNPTTQEARPVGSVGVCCVCCLWGAVHRSRAAAAAGP